MATNVTSADEVVVSVVIPCLDEAASVAECVRSAMASLGQHGIRGEVIVVDNGSSDGSAALADSAGACVVNEPHRGYGRAYLAGFSSARGRYLVMADADGTYALDDVPRFLSRLDAGADVVVGDRTNGVLPGAMPWLHRRLGNPLMSRTLDQLFHTRIRDAWCGMRALRREVLPTLDLRAAGMEFALEMLIRAAQHDLDIQELPIELRPRAGGQSKLRPARDTCRAVWMITRCAIRGAGAGAARSSTPETALSTAERGGA